MTGGKIQSLFLFYNELFTSAWLSTYFSRYRFLIAVSLDLAYKIMLCHP